MDREKGVMQSLPAKNYCLPLFINEAWFPMATYTQAKSKSCVVPLAVRSARCQCRRSKPRVSHRGDHCVQGALISADVKKSQASPTVSLHPKV